MDAENSTRFGILTLLPPIVTIIIDTRDEGGPISLDDGQGELNPVKPGSHGYRPEEKTKLSEILQALNDAYSTDFSESDRVFLTQIVNNMEKMMI